jgi:CRP-like cAMP-binding protein
MILKPPHDHLGIGHGVAQSMAAVLLLRSAAASLSHQGKQRDSLRCVRSAAAKVVHLLSLFPQRLIVQPGAAESGSEHPIAKAITDHARSPWLTGHCYSEAAGNGSRIQPSLAGRRSAALIHR